MKCPKCEGILSKIQFKLSKRIAYLYETCQSFWFTNEYMHETTGHMLDDYADGKNPKDMFFFIDNLDEDIQLVINQKQRQEYEKE